MPARARSSTAKDSTAHLGFEAKFGLAADSRSKAETAEDNLRNNMDAMEPGEAGQTAQSAARRVSKTNQPKHAVPGLIFLKIRSGHVRRAPGHHAWRKDESGSARAPRAVPGAPAGTHSATGEAALQKSAAGAPMTTRGGACAPPYATFLAAKLEPAIRANPRRLNCTL